MFTVTPVRAFDDNYIWVLHQDGRAVAVDPGEAGPLQAFLEANDLLLQAVLITHRHGDHVGGLPALTERWPQLAVYGPSTVPGITHSVEEGCSVPLFGQPFTVWAIPGHTREHLAFVAPGHAFCGDTLFGAGCGRAFDGCVEALAASVARLGHLPAQTRLYPAHEYTLANLKFARAVEPDNAALTERWSADTARRAQGQPTLPTTVELEHATNPFLRTGEPAVIAAASAWRAQPLSGATAVFAALRAWKDGFAG